MKNYWLERIDKRKFNIGVNLDDLQKYATDYAVFGTSEKELNTCLEKMGLYIVKRYAPPSMQNAKMIMELVIYCKKNIKKRGQAFGRYWGILAFNYCTTVMVGHINQIIRANKP
jgi:hypothetical protein